jgi:flagellar motor protein MotB
LSRRRGTIVDNPWPALSDLMVGFLFVIFLLLMVAILREEIEKKDIRRGVIQKLMAELGDVVEVDSEDGRIRIGQDKLTFANGSAVIPKQSEPLLDRIIPVLVNVLTDPAYGQWIGKVAVEGHTSTPGGDKVNWPLSARRAISVTTYIMEHAPPEFNDLLREKFEAIGRADRDLVRNPDNSENEDLSRRIEIKMLFVNPEEWKN